MSNDAEIPPPANTAPITATEPPPPYTPSPSAQASAPNPGFCPLAFSERHANRTPGGGMTAAQYFAPCAFCSTVIGDGIPALYKEGWAKTWVDPSVNFRWESHVPPTKEVEMVEVEKEKVDETVDEVVDEKMEKTEEKSEDEGDRKVEGAEEERLSCWLCWEYEERWIEPMAPDEWKDRRNAEEEELRCDALPEDTFLGLPDAMIHEFWSLGSVCYS
ncbi:uncharacterized protein BP5553_07350 [Venustampulla echinocandica]|uniref:Uncharacterized protein n=1 Tax=Venustampulla echinocandica TaxID=2656787 RepID=A0A370TJ84_9HELO|nr:uncharacterized protein BP5553_07350 [Venustampulla echinocandica]RDL35419.1 hypothetical protein BP5553_07350 [Venustampulla echinocandica]